MGDVNVCHILAVSHSILCFIAYAHGTNHSNATGGLTLSDPRLYYQSSRTDTKLYCESGKKTIANTNPNPET